MKSGLNTKTFFIIFLALLIPLVACKPNVDVGENQSTGDLIAPDVPAPKVIVLPTETAGPKSSPTLAEIKRETPYPIEEETLPENVETEPTLGTEQAAQPIDYPSSHYIRKIGGHSQFYYLSCESSAAIDWAWFFGVHIFESTFQADMPRSDNPDYGYVGDFTTRVWGQIPPYAYGVHAEPIAEGLRAYDLRAKAVKNYTLDEVKQMLSQDKPIIVWIIGNLEYSEPVEYVDKEGRVAIVAPFEHVVILTGYDEESIRYMNNGKFYDAPTEVFLTSWGVLGNMAVIYDDETLP